MENQKQNQQSDNLEQNESRGTDKHHNGIAGNASDNELGGLSAKLGASRWQRDLNDTEDDDKPPFTD